MTARCPNCGTAVPSNSVNCPKCFADIPRFKEEPKYAPADTGANRPGGKMALILSTIPALFGLLGLGTIYQNPKDHRGYIFLLLGLLVFACNVLLFKTMIGSGFFTALLVFIGFAIAALAYLGLAVAAFFDSLAGVRIRMLM